MFKLFSRLPMTAAIAAASVILVIGCVDSLRLAAPAPDGQQAHSCVGCSPGE